MTTQISQSARDRAIAAQTQNLEATNARQQRNATAAQGQAIYRGGGEFSTLGADGGSRPQGNVTSGGVPVGGVVPNAGGLVGGMPAPGDGDAVALKLLGERVAAVAFERGPIVGNGDPNTLEIAPRYPQDQYWAADTRTLWQWRATVGDVAGEWEVIFAPTAIDSGAPTPPGLIDGQGYYDLSTNQLYLWSDSGDEWLGPIGGGSGVILYGEGNPNGDITGAGKVPWQPQAQYYDLLVGRLFVSNETEPNNDNPLTWFPASRVTWHPDTLSLASQSGFHPGDILHGTTDHGIEGSEGGMIYTLNRAGAWVPQYTCCDEVPDPPLAPCLGPEGYEEDWAFFNGVKPYFPC